MDPLLFILTCLYFLSQSFFILILFPGCVKDKTFRIPEEMWRCYLLIVNFVTANELLIHEEEKRVLICMNFSHKETIKITEEKYWHYAEKDLRLTHDLNLVILCGISQNMSLSRSLLSSCEYRCTKVQIIQTKVAQFCKRV